MTVFPFKTAGIFRRVFDVFTRQALDSISNSTTMTSTRLPLDSTPLSSPVSYATATESPRNTLYATTTDIGSPIVNDGDAADKSYSKASQLPPELKQHCQIYLEENLCMLIFSQEFVVGGFH